MQVSGPPWLQRKAWLSTPKCADRCFRGQAGLKAAAALRSRPLVKERAGTICCKYWMRLMTRVRRSRCMSEGCLASAIRQACAGADHCSSWASSHRFIGDQWSGALASRAQIHGHLEQSQHVKLPRVRPEVLLACRKWQGFAAGHAWARGQTHRKAQEGSI